MKKIKENKYVILFFIIILILGLFTFNDYGIGHDEYLQQSHSTVNIISYYKLLGKLSLPKFMTESVERLIMISKYFPKLSTYEYKFYGVGVQLPFAILDTLPIFNFIDSSVIYYTKHLFCFILFFISLICFYKILNKYIVKNKVYSFIGTLFLLLSPRIYGEVFYNIKDTVFMSLFTINCYYILKYLEEDNILNIIKLSFITALTINSRVVGGIAIFMCVILKLIFDRKNIQKTIISIILIIIFTLLFFYIITPASWQNLIIFIIETLNFFFNYEDPINKTIQTCYYFGKLLNSNELPWHYLPVWIYITTPILYVILFVIGIYNYIKIFIKNKFKSINKYLLVLNLILFIMLLLICIVKPTLYGGWRHMYFLYPIIIINSVLGLKYVLDKYKTYKKYVYILIGVNSIVLVFWMILNHPYQGEYFHFPLNRVYAKNFEMNYSRISNSEAMNYIVKNDKNNYIKVYSSYNNAAHFLINNEDRNRIVVVKKHYNANYIIDNEITENTSISKKCKTLKIKKINGVRLYTIYYCGYK